MLMKLILPVSFYFLEYDYWEIGKDLHTLHLFVCSAVLEPIILPLI